MPLLLAVIATLGPTTPEGFCIVTEGRYLLDFIISCDPAEGLRPVDALRLTFRNLYSDQSVVHEHRLSQEARGAEVLHIQLLPADVALPPGPYHVRIDALYGTQPSGPQAAGSCELYVCREGESANHAIGSFLLSRVTYAWHPERGIYNRSIPALPKTIDPLDSGSRDSFWQKVGDAWELHPELQHDGGVAFLHGAKVFRKTGELDRAAFCETVLRRTVDTVLDRMMAPDGRLHALKYEGSDAKELYHVRQQDGFVLKLLSQAYLHFRDVAGDGDYARSILERMQPMVAYQFLQDNPLGCGGSGCKVYDGRILAGLAYFCLTEREASGEFDPEHVKTTLDFARRAAEHCLAQRGWYDDNCYAEGKCHIGFGTQNILCGLLPARRIALATGDDKLAEYLGDAATVGLEFLGRTNGKITGEIQWIPSRHSQWANGNMHEILDEIKAQLGESELLAWYYANLFKPAYGFGVVAFHRCDILATVMLQCDEYKQAR